MRQRRFLPSLRMLIAFDAVVRHGSVTAAADELAQTQSSVSRLLIALEDQLGRPLFLRERRRLIPTEAALDYARDIGGALDVIQRASTRFVANPRGGVLSLAVLPTFGTRWLAPRLGRFLEAHPGISINLATRVGRFPFDTGPFDAVVYFGAADWPAAAHLKLFDERMTACASPGFLARHGIVAPGDLLALPLLQLETRPHAWPDWFAHHGADGQQAGGAMMFDQFSIMIEAAISGLGAVLLPEYLAATEIDAGRLMPLFGRATPARGAYWLAWPEGAGEAGPLGAFRGWLVGQGDAAG